MLLSQFALTSIQQTVILIFVTLHLSNANSKSVSLCIDVVDNSGIVL